MAYTVGQTRTDVWGRDYKLCTYIKLDPRPGVLCEVRAVWVPILKPYVRSYKSSLNKEYYERVSKMKDDQESGQKKAGKWVPPSDPFLAVYPTISQFLTDCFFDNGKKRETSTLRVKWWGDCVDVSINDGEKRRTCTTTSDTLEAALQLLETHLASGGAPWRYWGDFKKK
jgi:hypothetical protein